MIGRQIRERVLHSCKSLNRLFRELLLRGRIIGGLERVWIGKGMEMSICGGLGDEGMVNFEDFRGDGGKGEEEIDDSESCTLEQLKPKISEATWDGFGKYFLFYVS